MRTVVPNRSFTGYPNGKRTRFPKDVPAEVSNEFAKSLEGKDDLVTIEAESKNNGRKAERPAPNETGNAEPASPKSDPEPAALAA